MKSLLTIVFVFSMFFANAGNLISSDNDVKIAEKESTMIKINGKIIDAKSQEALTGVKISVDGAEFTAYTDLDGNFEISLPSNLKDKEITVSYISYEEVAIEISNSKDLTIEINPID